VTLVKVVIGDTDEGRSLLRGLARHGIRTRRGQAHDVARDEPEPDLVLIALTDPVATVVAWRAARASRSPLLVLTDAATARSLEDDADDGVTAAILVRPADLSAVVGQIRALTSARMVGAAVRRIGRLEVDERRHVVTVDGATVRLAPREYALLAFLAAAPGAVRTRAAIEEHVWGTGWDITRPPIAAHVSSLRRKLGQPHWIVAVRGVGYRLSECE